MNGTPLSVLYHRYIQSQLAKYDLSYSDFAYYYTKWVNQYNCK